MGENFDHYRIYQLKDNPELNRLRFEGTWILKRMGITKCNFDVIKVENYELVYGGELLEVKGRIHEKKEEYKLLAKIEEIAELQHD